jgi:hypothetical protein
MHQDKKAPTKVSTAVKEKKVKAGEGGSDEEEGDGNERAMLGLKKWESH